MKSLFKLYLKDMKQVSIEESSYSQILMLDVLLYFFIRLKLQYSYVIYCVYCDTSSS